MKIFKTICILVVTLFIYPLNGQINSDVKTIIVSESDTNNFYTKKILFPPCIVDCIFNPSVLLKSVIKPNKYKNGTYIFYGDRSRQNILFKGNITNGKPTGYYYQPNFDWGGEEDGSIRLPDEFTLPVKIKEGSIDSTFCPTNVNEIQFYFQSGVIQNISFISDVSFHHKLSFYFTFGKLDSVTNYSKDSRFSSERILLSGKIKLDSSKYFRKMDKPENIYTGLDSSKVLYSNNMKDESGDLYYDSLLNLRRIFINNQVIPNNTNSGGISFLFDLDQKIRYIIFPYMCSKGEYWTNCSFICFSFLSDGSLKIE